MGDSKPPVLSYRSGIAGSRWARWTRVTLLVGAVISLQLAVVLILHPAFGVHEMQQWLGGGVIGTPFSPIDGSMNEEAIQQQYLPRALAYLAIFLLTQWAFLAARGTWRFRRSEDGPPPLRAAIAAGFIGMLLAVGFLATLMEIPNWWIALTAPGGIGPGGRFGVLHGRQNFAAVWPVMLILWTVWTISFYIYWRSLDRYTALRRVLRWLVSGTILEMILAAPVHALVVYNRGNDCYCARGSWTGIAFGCTSALWLFGPGAFIVMWREKKRFEAITSSPEFGPPPDPVPPAPVLPADPANDADESAR